MAPKKCNAVPPPLKGVSKFGPLDPPELEGPQEREVPKIQILHTGGPKILNSFSMAPKKGGPQKQALVSQITVGRSHPPKKIFNGPPPPHPVISERAFGKKAPQRALAQKNHRSKRA